MLADLSDKRRAQIREERRKRPHWKMLLGCERCRSVCTDAGPCKCCKSYKQRTAGGTMSFYPDDGKGHYQICEVAAV
jgi:hypothetical protein